MKVENNFIYKLTDRLGTLAVIPLGEKGFSLDFERQNEDKLSYEKKLSGKIMFVGEAFQRLNQMENSVYRCDEQTLTILKVCNGIEKVIFVGKISLNEAEFNLDKCQIVTKFLEDKTGCELLSFFSIFGIQNNNVRPLLERRIVVNCFHFSVSLGYKTTQILIYQYLN